MFSSDAGRVASARLTRVGWLLHAYVVETKLCALRDTVKKYDPNQPRVPAGNPDGGQWTDGGGGSTRPPRLPRGPGTLLDLGDGRQSERIRLAANKPRGHLTDVTPRPRNLPRDIQELSDIPAEKPKSTKTENAVVKFLAYRVIEIVAVRTALRGIARGELREKVARRVRRALFAAKIASWVTEESLFSIISYHDRPRSLEELRGAVSRPRKGYEIHHIVEQNSAQPGEEARINSRENLVRIPKFKHHLITGFYKARADAYGKKSLRDGLKDQDWETRYQEGIDALIQFGVLKP